MRANKVDQPKGGEIDMSWKARLVLLIVLVLSLVCVLHVYADIPVGTQVASVAHAGMSVVNAGTKIASILSFGSKQNVETTDSFVESSESIAASETTTDYNPLLRIDIGQAAFALLILAAFVGLGIYRILNSTAKRIETRG